jgi:hypothetical protein
MDIAARFCAGAVAKKADSPGEDESHQRDSPPVQEPSLALEVRLSPRRG